MPVNRLIPGLLALIVVATSGCVRREMLITSKPEGASVLVNQTWKGETPFRLRFKHYGTYDIRLEAPGYYPLHVKEPVRAPAYERMGVDFVSEVLVPARIEDKRELHYQLEKIETEDDIDGILARSGELKAESTRIADKREQHDKDRDPIPLPLPLKDGKEEAPEKDAEPEQPARKEAAAEPAEPQPEQPSTPELDAP